MKFPNITFEGFIKNTIYTFGSAFILYVLSLFTQPAINFLSSISQSFSNFYYKFISIGDANQFLTFVTSLVLFLVLITFAGSIFYLTRTKAVLRSLSKEHQEIEKQSEKEDIKKENYKINKGENRISKAFSIINYGRIVLFLTAFSIYITYLFLINVNAENAVFDRKLVFLAPYVENQAILLLKSDWTMMESKSDYDRIYKHIGIIQKKIIEQLKKDNNITNRLNQDSIKTEMIHKE